MSTQPIPIDEFAKRLRTKYPGAYDSLSDAQLVQKVVSKYPDYKEHIASFAPTDFEKERSGSDAGGFIPNFISAAKNVVGGLLEGNGPPLGAEAAGQGIAQAGQFAADDISRKQQGRSLPYRVAAPVAQTLVPGLNPPAMEKAAEQGDAAGVLGQAAVPAAIATAPLAAEGVYRAAKAGRESLSTSLRDEYGRLKPGVKAVTAAGKLVGLPEVAEALIPDRADAYSPMERRAVPVTNNPNPAGYKGPNSIPTPEPELGSPDNPAFHSKLPSRLPQSLRGDPFAPPQAADAPEAMRQIEAATEPNPASVAVVPEPRAPLPSDRPGSAWSLTRTKGLPEAALRGQPGAADVLRQVGQPVVMTPRSGGFDSPNMQALRESLGITESVPHTDPFAPAPAEVPQGNDSPFAPWLKPRRTPVLQ